MENIVQQQNERAKKIVDRVTKQVKWFLEVDDQKKLLLAAAKVWALRDAAHEKKKALKAHLFGVHRSQESSDTKANMALEVDPQYQAAKDDEDVFSIVGEIARILVSGTPTDANSRAKG